jgi:hypothetical protein
VRREPFAPETLEVLLPCFVTHKVPKRALSCLLLGFSQLRVLPLPAPVAASSCAGQAVLKRAFFLPSEEAAAAAVEWWDLEEEDGDGGDGDGDGDGVHHHHHHRDRHRRDRWDLDEPEALDTMAEWLSFAVLDEGLAHDVVALVEAVHNLRLALPRAFYVRVVTNLCARWVRRLVDNPACLTRRVRGGEGGEGCERESSSLS